VLDSLSQHEHELEVYRYALWCAEVNMNKRQRITAHIEHLRVAFQTPYPVRVAVTMPAKTASARIHAPRGITHRRGKEIIIELNGAFPRWSMHDTLNHEWAHAMDWRPASLEKMRWSLPPGAAFENVNGAAAEQYRHEQVHDDHFYLDLGRVERAFEGWEV
jgi:hypothetical protein